MNIYKIFNLIKLIFIRLRYRLSKTISILFRKLIIYLRKLNLNLKIINIINKDKKKNKINNKFKKNV